MHTGAVLPGEICDIEPGQLYKKKVPPALMQDMLRFSVKEPLERLQSICAGVEGQVPALFLSLSTFLR